MATLLEPRIYQPRTITLPLDAVRCYADALRDTLGYLRLANVDAPLLALAELHDHLAKARDLVVSKDFDKLQAESAK